MKELEKATDDGRVVDKDQQIFSLSKSQTDAIVVILFTLLVIVADGQLQFFHQWTEFVHLYKKWRLDKISIVLVSLSFALVWYAWRRQKRANFHKMEARKLKAKAEAADRAKSDFLANTSHDLRSPLNAIIGFSEMMRLRTFGSLGDPHYEEYVKDIHSSGKLLLSLIDDIMDLSKIEAGKYQLYEVVMDISECISDSVKIHLLQAGAKNINLTSAEGQGPLYLLGDETAFVRIINNLISNAIKFTPKEGKVTVNSWISDAGYLNIKVSDTGMGMSEEDIAKALNPFEQVDSEHSRKHEGTGLGLPLSCLLVELHGGKIVFNSKKGTGTKVLVSFPPERVGLRKQSA